MRPNLTLDGNHEQRRLRTLRSLNILDTPAERSFDRLAEEAARLYRAPFGLVTFVDEQRQYFKAAVGTELRGTVIEASFCRYTIQHDAVMVVPDAPLDPRFTGNPLVRGKAGVRFYAGAPITHDGFRLGAVCILDTVPRDAASFDPRPLIRLAALASLVVEHRRTGSNGELDVHLSGTGRN